MKSAANALLCLLSCAMVVCSVSFVEHDESRGMGHALPDRAGDTVLSMVRDQAHQHLPSHLATPSLVNQPSDDHHATDYADEDPLLEGVGVGRRAAFLNTGSSFTLSNGGGGNDNIG